MLLSVPPNPGEPEKACDLLPCYSQRPAVPFLARHFWALPTALFRREAVGVENEAQTQRQSFPCWASAFWTVERNASPILSALLWEGRHCHSPRGMSMWLGNHSFLLVAPALSSFFYLAGACLPWVGAPREPPDCPTHRDQLGRLPGSQSDRLSREHGLCPEPWCLPHRLPGSAPGVVVWAAELTWHGLLALCSGQPLALDSLVQSGFGGVSSMAAVLVLT